jgi:DNA-binding transcriptional MerR regulator
VRIGELADQADVGAKTIRYWESVGLLAEPARTPSGYRDYPPEAIATIGFIRSAQAAGFTLAEIDTILAIRADGEAPCAHVASLIDRHLHDVDGRLAELRQTRRQLRDLAGRARQFTNADDCTPDSICRILTD